MSELVPNPGIHKTEAEVAQQIARITQKLGERAVGIRDYQGDILGSDTIITDNPDSTEKTHSYNMVSTNENQGTIELEKVKSEWGGGVFDDGLTNESAKVSVDTREGTVKGVHSIKTIKVNELEGGSTDLSLNQSKTAAARILGATRSRISSHKSNDQKRADEFIRG